MSHHGDNGEELKLYKSVQEIKTLMSGIDLKAERERLQNEDEELENDETEINTSGAVQIEGRDQEEASSRPHSTGVTSTTADSYSKMYETKVEFDVPITPAEQSSSGSDDDAPSKEGSGVMVAESSSTTKKKFLVSMASSTGLLKALEEASARSASKRLSGDFGTATHEDAIFGEIYDELGPLDTQEPEIEGEQEPEPEPEPSVEEEEEEQGTPVNREEYYERYALVKDPHTYHKARNNYLQKRMVDYFRKRHMDHVFKEYETQFNNVNKYHKVLDQLGELMEIKELRCRTLRTEIRDRLWEKTETSKEIKEVTASLLNREKDIGMGLINTKTGKPIPDKVVEMLIKRQRNKIKELANLRLTYIKLRNMVMEKEEALAKIEVIAPGCTLRLYEQLKLDNRSRADKVELKEHELVRLREQVRDRLQATAHLKEKTSCFAVDLTEASNGLDEVDMDLTMVREQISYLKTQKDFYRKAYVRVKENAGLINYPHLLRDYENSIEDVDEMTVQLRRIKKEVKMKTAQIRGIRKRIEVTKEQKRHGPREFVLGGEQKKKKKKKPKEMDRFDLAKRPSLMEPVLAHSTLDTIMHIRDMAFFE